MHLKYETCINCWFKNLLPIFDWTLFLLLIFVCRAALIDMFPNTSLVNLFRDINRCKRNFHNVAISKRDLQISRWINISLTFLKNKSNTSFRTEHSHNHNFNFKYSYNKIRVGNRNAFGVSVGKPKCNRPLSRTRHRWEDPIKMGVKETGLEGMAWIKLAQDRASGWVLIKMVINLQVL